MVVFRVRRFTSICYCSLTFVNCVVSHIRLAYTRCRCNEVFNISYSLTLVHSWKQCASSCLPHTIVCMRRTIIRSKHTHSQPVTLTQTRSCMWYVELGNWRRRKQSTVVITTTILSSLVAAAAAAATDLLTCIWCTSDFTLLFNIGRVVVVRTGAPHTTQRKEDNEKAKLLKFVFYAVSYICEK